MEGKHRSEGHHECEIFSGRDHEVGESYTKWVSCEKNPGHPQFISVKNFEETYLPKVGPRIYQRALRATLDLTVRLRVFCTSSSRPDDDDMADLRGTSTLRLGTGFIEQNGQPVMKKTRHFGGSFWTFFVRTAHHVVHNTEEAKETKVDLFYDDESSDQDGGTMKSVWGTRVIESHPGTDFCRFMCTTNDPDIAHGIRLSGSSRCIDKSLPPPDMSHLDMQPSSGSDGCVISLVVSHPHGQPKKVTVGKMTFTGDDYLIKYTSPTCPGSSGAPVLFFSNYNSLRNSDSMLVPNKSSSSVHIGSFHNSSTRQEDQTNYSYRIWISY